MTERVVASSSGTVASAVLNGIIFVTSVAGFVALEITGRDTTGLVLLVGPVIGAVFVTSTLRPQLARVEAQTNGVLDERIHRQTKSAVTATLLEAGIITPEPGAVWRDPGPAAQHARDVADERQTAREATQP